MEKLLHQLEIPPEYSRYGPLTQESGEFPQGLNEWKDRSASQLSDLATHLSAIPELSLQDQTLLVLQVSRYDGDGLWSSEVAKAEAQKILSTYIKPTVTLLQNVLATQIRPVFQSNLHPNLNPDTGRRLARAAGGPLASQDLYTSQSWKENSPGVANVLMWIVKQLKSEDYEQLWHLVIPPVMILLDDYDAEYKFQGIQAVAEMLKTVPAELLRRTGVDGLLYTSLKATLSFLHNPKTPVIIRTSVPTLVALINIISPASCLGKNDRGKQRFDQLSSILGEGIIGSIWMYASRDLGAMRASIDVLPLIVDALGIGSVRYLKAMIHQLVHPLLPLPPGVDVPSSSQPAEDELKLVCLRGLRAVIKACEPRISFWKGTILDATTRCWVLEVEKQGSSEIIMNAKEVITELRRSCPTIVDNEFARLRDIDPIFVNLLEFHDAT